MANPYYNHTSGVPAVQTRGSSPNMRAEFDAVATGFNGVYTEILALAAAVGIAVTVSEVPVASSATTDIGNGYGPVVKITGTNPITSFGANYKGAIFLRFENALLLTHSSSLVFPGAANITTVAGDACIAIPIGNPASGWRIAAYCRMSQTLIDDVAVRTSSTYANPAWLTSLAWSKLTGTPTTLAGYGISDAPTKTGTGASGSWGIDITGWAKSAGAGADIASAATLDLTGRTGNIIDVTGTVESTSITLEAGGRVLTVAVAAWPINVAGILVYTCVAGDMVEWSKDLAGTLRAVVYKKGQAPTFIDSPFDLTATVGSNALTITLKKGGWFFRNPTLGTGAFEYVKTDTDLSLTISSGSTLGGVNAVATNVLVRVANDAGTLRLTAENLAGGMDSSEMGVISTTAEGAAGAADSATTIYSGTAVASKAYRTAGLVVSTQATAGTWVTNPSLVQGAGGNALTSMMSLGYGQTWQNLTGSRALSTQYYNTTGRSIKVRVYGTGTAVGAQYITMTINGVAIVFCAGGNSGFATNNSDEITIPAGASYIASAPSVSLNNWYELR